MTTIWWWQKFQEKLAVNRQTTHRVHMGRFSLNKLSKVEGREQYHVEVSNRFAALGNIAVEVDINRAWDTVRKNIKISSKESLGY
jgi:hypothetical protein